MLVYAHVHVCVCVHVYVYDGCIYRVMQNRCRALHSTHNSPLTFDLTLGAIRLAKSGFKVQG